MTRIMARVRGPALDWIGVAPVSVAKSERLRQWTIRRRLCRVRIRDSAGVGIPRRIFIPLITSLIVPQSGRLNRALSASRNTMVMSFSAHGAGII
jgi:hypothetical protein